MSLTLPPPALLPSATYASPLENLWFPANGNLVINGNQTVTGATTVGGSCSVGNGALNVSGDTTLSGNLNVTASSALLSSAGGTVSAPNATTVTLNGYTGEAYQGSSAWVNLPAGLRMGVNYGSTGYFITYPVGGNAPTNPISVTPPAASPSLVTIGANSNKLWVRLDASPGGFGTFVQVNPPSSGGQGTIFSPIPFIVSSTIPIGTSGFFYNFTNAPGSIQISNFTGSPILVCVAFI